MQPYSLDFRQKIVSAYENGVETIVEVAERFEVSPSFIKKMLAQNRLTGSIAPVGHRGGQPRRLADKHRKWLLKTVLDEPDITLSDLQERLAGKSRLPCRCRRFRANCAALICGVKKISGRS